MDATVIEPIQLSDHDAAGGQSQSDSVRSALEYHEGSNHTRPVIDISRFNAFPPAARTREFRAAANTFASSGKNIYVHYTEPILAHRRALLLKLRTTKKLFHKTAAQLWSTIGHEEDFFWNEQAKSLRLSLKQKTLSFEDCLKYAGRPERGPACVWHAELAVSRYLGIAPPVPLDESTGRDLQTITPVALDIHGLKNVLEEISLAPVDTRLPQQDNDKIRNIVQCCGTTLEAQLPAHSDPTNADLLDVLPSPFEVDRRSLYGNFANLDHDEIKRAEGRTQTMYLRRVAQMLDDTGKELFYYYMVPRLCATIQPRPDGSTVTGIAADVWKILPGPRKATWREKSHDLKQRLGDGNVFGLEMLELGSLDEEVLMLHEVAKEDLESHRASKG